MSGSYESNKISIYNWRNKNREKWNEYRSAYLKKKRIWLQISLIFLNILLD